MGSVETLIVWENLDCNRIVLKNHTTGGMCPIVLLSEFGLSVKYDFT